MYWSICFKPAKKWLVGQTLVNVHMEIGIVYVVPWVCSKKVSLWDIFESLSTVILPIPSGLFLSGTWCASEGCVCLSDLVHRAAGCLCREVLVSCGGSYLLNLSVCFLQWLKSSSPYMKATTWRCDYFSASHPLTQTHKKLFAHLSVNCNFFNSVSSLPCAVCRFFFLIKRI